MKLKIDKTLDTPFGPLKAAIHDNIRLNTKQITAKKLKRHDTLNNMVGVHKARTSPIGPVSLDFFSLQIKESSETFEVSAKATLSLRRLSLFNFVVPVPSNESPLTLLPVSLCVGLGFLVKIMP